MEWFRNTTVGTKLIFGFSTMIIFMAIIGLFGFTSIEGIHGSLTKIFSVNLPSINYLAETDRDLQAALVAERSMIFANSQSDEFKGLVKEYEEKLKQAKDRWEKYGKLAATADEKTIIQRYEKANEEWRAVSGRVVAGRVADTREGRREALDLSLGAAKQKFEEMRKHLNQLTEISLRLAEADEKVATHVYNRSIILFLGILGSGIVIGILLMWTIGRSVTKPLRAIIEGLSSASDQVSSGASQVSSASQSVAEGSSEQAASIEETSSSLEEMSSMTKQNADNAGQAKAKMAEVREIVSKVNKHMGDMAESISEISKSSEETGKIIKTIDEIAFQTNLLALNAAVEAARAGEAGAGFAVVAGEVRNLAMRAAEAAKSTANLIESTIKAVKSGNQITQSTQTAFKENMTISGKVGELVDEIAAASNEQAQGIDQVNKAVAEMDKVVQQTAANAEESASAAEEMNAQAQQLKHFVAQLVSLVGGAGSRSGTMSSAGAGHVNATSRQVLPVIKGATTGRELVPHKAGPARRKEVTPKEVIPLGDETFKDF
jgi:methyl-accepting chemotaxis protein